MKSIFLGIWILASWTCSSDLGRQESSMAVESASGPVGDPIGAYVPTVYQDSRGVMWFGTLEKGVARYDGKELSYLTTVDGLPSDRVVHILEDDQGILWFGTGDGLSSYDGARFTNYTMQDGLCSNSISSLYVDGRGGFWVGTWGGLCRFVEGRFEAFALDYPEVDTKINPDTKDWITIVTEDREGRVWIGRDGYGVAIWDGNQVTHMTTRDGLNSNFVQAIQEDEEGNIWIGTRMGERDSEGFDMNQGRGGLNKWDGEKFEYYKDINGFSGSDIYAIFKDEAGHIWVSTTSHGVYRHIDGEFVAYEVPASTMSFGQDGAGVMWLGCAGGLYRIGTGGDVILVTTEGPWR